MPATRAASAGSATNVSSRLVQGPSATIVTGSLLVSRTRPRSVDASSGMPVPICGGMSMPHAVSGPTRQSAGNGRPSGPASSRPHATGMSLAPSWPSRYDTLRRPGAQWTRPVPSTRIARTSIAGSRSRIASAAMSLLSRSRSTTTGRGPEALAEEPGVGTADGGCSGVRDASALAHAPETTASATTRSARSERGLICMGQGSRRGVTTSLPRRPASDGWGPMVPADGAGGHRFCPSGAVRGGRPGICKVAPGLPGSTVGVPRETLRGQVE